MLFRLFHSCLPTFYPKGRCWVAFLPCVELHDPHAEAPATVSCDRSWEHRLAGSPAPIHEDRFRGGAPHQFITQGGDLYLPTQLVMPERIIGVEEETPHSNRRWLWRRPRGLNHRRPPAGSAFRCLFVGCGIVAVRDYRMSSGDESNESPARLNRPILSD